MLIPRRPIDIVRSVAILTLSKGSYLFSNNKGANEKFLAIEYKCDSFLNIVTGKEILRILFPLRILLPKVVMTYLNIFFCSLIMA